MKRSTQLLAALAVVGALAAPATASAQTAVDLELSLLVDVSGSVDAGEFALQRTGYVNAFKSAALWDAINHGALKKIAVNYIQWSSTAVQSIGWTLIDSYSTMEAFANAIAMTARPSSGVVGSSTGIGNAMSFATPLFFTNSYLGTRQVMDISGDGCSNVGTAPLTARNAAVAAGVDVINGIVIAPLSAGCALTAHYTSNVIAGAGSFVLEANSFDDFEAGIERKLIREITTPTTVPEPASVVLMGTGLVAIAGIAARRRKQA